MEILSIAQSDLIINIYDNIYEAENQWNIKNYLPVLLSMDYLKGLEKAKPLGLKTLYGICLRKGETLALFHLQVISFDAEKRLYHQIETGVASTLSDKIALAIKLFIARKVKLQGAIIGNLLTAGPFGIVFHENMNSQECGALIVEMCNALLQQSATLKDVQIIVLKDIDPERRILEFDCKKYQRLNEFTIQPSMRIMMRKHWNTMDDYLEDLESKYRTKIKRAIRLGAPLIVKEVSYEEILENEEHLFSLYQEVAESAGFNLIELNKSYLSTIKNAVPEFFKVKLIYHDQSLVGFYTYFLEFDVLNAHFIGYKKSMNKSHELYHNILLYYLQDAIQYKIKQIEFARTALEIKSSLGAIPIDYYCYIAHESKFINKIIPRILDLLKPVEEWKPRSPFKD